MSTVDSIVEAFGGVKAVATLLNVSPQAVANMRARASIPAEYWRSLVAEAAARGIEGVTLDALSAIAPRRKKPAASTEAAA